MIPTPVSNRPTTSRATFQGPSDRNDVATAPHAPGASGSVPTAWPGRAWADRLRKDRDWAERLTSDVKPLATPGWAPPGTHGCCETPGQPTTVPAPTGAAESRVKSSPPSVLAQLPPSALAQHLGSQAAEIETAVASTGFPRPGDGSQRSGRTVDLLKELEETRRANLETAAQHQEILAQIEIEQARQVRIKQQSQLAEAQLTLTKLQARPVARPARRCPT